MIQLMITHRYPILFLPAQSRVSGMAAPEINPGVYFHHNKRVLTEKIVGSCIIQLLFVKAQVKKLVLREVHLDVPEVVLDLCIVKYRGNDHIGISNPLPIPFLE